MNNKVLGFLIQLLLMAIIISVILLFVGIAFLILVHVCVVGRAFRRGFSAGSSIEERSSNRGDRMSIDDLEKLPSFEFKTGEKGNNDVDCAVCLESYNLGEKCRLLPICKHSFHAQCVDSWLLKTPICPICRTIVDSRKYSEAIELREIQSVMVETELGSNPFMLQTASASQI
ncbi:RING-H2 finger protein ATL39-like [Macadamia integrifolia]|uniref:RING-H2 finger protein ATL39-like n=1 Tax=Macadamia integrifolia TaxID=60698 RepID=UPI001C4FC939|nr:RING-H2 finger protein ATL39-like [Macadamia integrifolia]